MRVIGERRDSVNQPQLPSHPKMHHQHQVSSSPFMGRWRRSRRRGSAGGASIGRSKRDEDVFASPPHGLDARPHHLIDELFRLGVPDDGRKAQLAADDGAAKEVRSQVGDDGLDFG